MRDSKTVEAELKIAKDAVKALTKEFEELDYATVTLTRKNVECLEGAASHFAGYGNNSYYTENLEKILYRLKVL